MKLHELFNESLETPTTIWKKRGNSLSKKIVAGDDINDLIKRNKFEIVDKEDEND